MLGKMNESDGELKISFGYQCNGKEGDTCDFPEGIGIPSGIQIPRNSRSFSCLSGAALSANATLANTNICNGLIGEGILPSLDSPRSFRRVPSSPSLARSDILSSSLQSGISYLSCSPSSLGEPYDWDSHSLQSTSAPSRSESFLNAIEVEVAGGAAGEDRVQAVCSEENGWLFCAIYDGFNGRDAADFLAGTLYETIGFYLGSMDRELKQESVITSDGSHHFLGENCSSDEDIPCRVVDNKESRADSIEARVRKKDISQDLFRNGVLDSLQRALSQAENDFLNMVEREMEDRPDLVSVGSCVLVVLLHGKDLYTLNLGDSRAVLATYSDAINMDVSEALDAIQLTGSHTVDNELERKKLLDEHPDDPATVVAGRVKGKLKVTRAFGVGYLKKGILNDALMGILQVRNLLSPPYISTQPSLNIHRISKDDSFVIVGSDGLFDFFSNEEAVRLVQLYILSNPSGDPAKFLLEQLVLRAADRAGFSTEELMRIPAGRRRKYHDDVTVIVIILGSNHRTSKASTVL
ncbi:hypothetical protein AQUCO_01700210v1 [Aquilegia coerulea]|uniref:PPM-type phosphatase domain-containing protein n=1 Tax=Aquilegia coerulea TaxID=218851 RepID=A0A2G5DLR6_AQUCA|nr:hypothetical protein AQUCO_01700210v1 [Aquilegia coerulea]PIA44452.1 hypothetical protein AQUCO_01700210v1 [Aquilegia coerulea]